VHNGTITDLPFKIRKTAGLRVPRNARHTPAYGRVSKNRLGKPRYRTEMTGTELIFRAMSRIFRYVGLACEENDSLTAMIQGDLGDMFVAQFRGMGRTGELSKRRACPKPMIANLDRVTGGGRKAQIHANMILFGMRANSTQAGGA
jgi:hypothetical protein